MLTFVWRIFSAVVPHFIRPVIFNVFDMIYLNFILIKFTSFCNFIQRFHYSTSTHGGLASLFITEFFHKFIIWEFFKSFCTWNLWETLKHVVGSRYRSFRVWYGNFWKTRNFQDTGISISKNFDFWPLVVPPTLGGETWSPHFCD